ncbi:MAG TPA: UvrD-helicase domain-containing protein [Candidatus Binatus sp.]|nr:UvrD-helicase domain-containing protein [Candidatus Binatus sp.]
MRAESSLAVVPTLERVASAPAGVTVVTGPPGSGKTSALAARAARLARQAPVHVICSHASGVRVFERHVRQLGAEQGIRVATGPQHCVHWLRTHYALAGVHPDIAAGGEAAARVVVRQAAQGLLDMTWPEVDGADLDLDVPFLSWVDKFLEEAAVLIRQLRGARISPEEFERGCALGITAFYGDEVEAALVKSADPQIVARVGRRGREALRAGAGVLQQQKRAERSCAVLLARLYREYLRCARTARSLSDEDLLDECIRWLSADRASARAIAASCSAVLVDDAEDANAALSELLTILHNAGLQTITLAGWPDAAIDGLEGRRSALSALAPDLRIELPLLSALPTPQLRRYADEGEESGALAGVLRDLLQQGVPPDSMAVLTRSDDAAIIYSQRLRDAGLPVDPPLGGFEEPAQLLDWLALAAVVDDPADQVHWLRVLASPLLGLADASIYALCEDPEAVTQLALDVGVGDERTRPRGERQRTALSLNLLEGRVDDRLPDAVRDVLGRFRLRFEKWRREYAGLPPAGVLARLARSGGFVSRWQENPLGRARRLDDMVRVIEAFAGAHARGIASLNAIVHAFEEGDIVVRDAMRSADAIACDSIASAKGERWPHVLVAGVAYERFPRVYVPRAMAFSRTYGLIVRENVAPGAAQTAKFAWYYARFDAKGLYLAQERRALAYGLSRGSRSAYASGFGSPPRWAKDYDLLPREERRS